MMMNNNNNMMNMNMMNMMMNNNMMNNNMRNNNVMYNNMMMNNMMNNNMMMNNMMMNNNMKNMGMNSTLNRIKKEFQLCQNDSELIQIGCSFGLVNPNNIFQWKVTMVGPNNTPYENGLFTIFITFPPNYPKYGAEFKFQNKIYHLNVDWRENGDKGHICLSTLNEWKSTGRVKSKKGFGVKQALFDIFCLFFNQGIESAYDEKIAKLYKDNREQFNQEAKKWTQKYAK